MTESARIHDWKIDNRPHRKGWAPGDYLGKCVKCGAFTQADKRAQMCADCAYEDWKPTHRHGKTGGLYRLTDQRVTIEATNTNAVVYEAQDGTFWVRPYSEFHDGRFARIEE